ncbi:MAG: hypothetical protein Q4F80_00525 [bacterium]|nr:hypothetical protein [bacterium]
MAYTYFDPSTATDLAKFQGSFAGYQAGNATVTGVAMAPTSIYNQAGYYALQDSDTGYVTLQKMADDSLYTKQWYDQGTGTIFDFTDGGTGITSTKTPTSTTSNSTNPVVSNSQTTTSNSTSQSNSTTNSSNQTSTSTTSNTTTQNSTSTTSSGLIQYPWGAGYIPVSPDNGATTTTTTNANGTSTTTIVDENGDQIMLDASDLQELVDSGVYDSLEEALNATLSQGYGVSDEEQAKLGIYSDADEEKIQLMMEKYGYTREEAIDQLGGKIEPKDDTTELQAKIDNLINSGFSHDEAIEYMEALGYDIPDELKVEPEQYSDEDEARIAALQSSTGCSREDAIKALGCKPEEPEKLGLIRSIGKGIGDFFGGIGKGISNAWDSFVDFIW